MKKEVIEAASNSFFRDENAENDQRRAHFLLNEGRMQENNSSPSDLKDLSKEAVKLRPMKLDT